MAAVVFTESFTGTNGDGWNATRWPTQSSEGTVTDVIDIQSNRGHARAGTATDDFVSINGSSATSLEDSHGELWIDPDPDALNDTHNQWLYVCLRSTGEQVAANAGRPATAYYFRFKMGDGQTGANDDLYRRLSNSEVNLVSGIDNHGGTSHDRDVNDPFWFKWEIASNAGDVDFRWKMWAAVDSEPGTWIEYTDTSPGALATASGVLQIIGRNFAGGQDVSFALDDIEITDPDATPGAADTSLGHFAQMATLLG